MLRRPQECPARSVWQGQAHFADWTALRPRLIASSLPTAEQTAAPTGTRAAAPTAATSDKPDDEKQHDGAYGGVDDRTDNSHTKMDTEPRQQPVADEGADNADYHVTDEAKAGPLHDSPGSNADQ
ncbi:MAG: hypothetical protein ABSC95_12265 [Acetobacteraceae bacterium]